jgi:DNA-binding NarL/FixJ family response regulator
MTVRVLLADDHGAIRAGLTMMLGNDPDIEVIGEAADGDTAIRQARALRPDVVLMDVRMPGTDGADGADGTDGADGADGIAATRRIVTEGLAEVLVLTTFDLDQYVHAALRAGAAGFLLKSVEPTRLIEAVKLVAARDGAPAPPNGLDDLTDREREVFGCLGSGMSNAQISSRLHIGETTVKTHVSRVLTKLGVRSRVQAAILAKEFGLVVD